MKHSLFRWGTALLATLAIAGCGGGGGGGTAPTEPSTGTAVSTAIVKASADPANDTSTNTSSAFTVLQDAGLPAVTVNSPPVVNFTVFSDGKVVTGLTNTNTRFAIAKLVPGSNGEPDEWVSYVTALKKGVAGYGPNGTPVLESAPQASTDTSTAAQLVYNPDGYYTYTFKTDITKIAGVPYEPNLTHRIAIQLSYKNAAGETVNVNPYYDFTLVNGKSVTVTDPNKTRKMTDVASCNSCHEKLALHGGGRVDTQYCVMCHNPGTVDPESGNVLTLSTMVHSIHAGRRIKAESDEDYTIWGYSNSKHDYAEVGFPQDLRNCSKCHTAANPATPQGDNWKTAVSQQACLTCHTAQVGGDWEVKHVVYAKAASATNTKATDLTNAQCVACHKVVSNISPEVVHWNQNEENSAKYKMNIESATYVADSAGDTTKKGTVTVKYFLSDPTNGNAAYDLITPDCTAAAPNQCNVTQIPPGSTRAVNITKFGNLTLYVAYQNMVGQSTAVTEFSAYSNSGRASIAAYKGIKDDNNHYTVDIPLLADKEGISFANGTARVLSIGQVKEPELELKSLDPRPAVVPAAQVNVLVQNTHKDVLLSGAFQPRREVVSNAKCNDCHGSLGSTSGSNTLANAFHSGARNTVEACAMCHDANFSNSGSMMTNGLALYEPYQFKRMIHGIHGNSKRVSPFTHGNTVVDAFCNPAGTTQAAIDICKIANSTVPPLTLASGVENYAAEVAYPGVGLNCNACHVNNSYKNDLGTLGAVVMKPAAVLPATGLEADPNKWLVISPKAASCTSCHDSSAAIGHVTSFGGSAFGDKTQKEIAALPRETCNDCHASGGFKGVDIVHGQK
jgi:OmcA/MtrC family decaheme c-type cytochrome